MLPKTRKATQLEKPPMTWNSEMPGRQPNPPFEDVGDLERFFADCDALGGPAQEPDWEQHRAVIEESRLRGSSET